VGDCSGTLQSKNKPGYSLNFQNPVRTGYIVRRLTPTECERLQGFPDGWTAFGAPAESAKDSAGRGGATERASFDAHGKASERSPRRRHDGKEISDTRRYQMLGNSVAIPCVAFVLGGIAAQESAAREEAA
jgi:DNA (cytosine-5)-methyltransferase 1